MGLAFGGAIAQKVIAAIAHAAKLGPSATLGVPVRSTTNVATSKWWSEGNEHARPGVWPLQPPPLLPPLH